MPFPLTGDSICSTKHPHDDGPRKVQSPCVSTNVSINAIPCLPYSHELLVSAPIRTAVLFMLRQTVIIIDTGLYVDLNSKLGRGSLWRIGGNVHVSDRGVVLLDTVRLRSLVQYQSTTLSSINLAARPHPHYVPPKLSKNRSSNAEAQPPPSDALPLHKNLCKPFVFPSVNSGKL